MTGLGCFLPPYLLDQLADSGAIDPDLVAEMRRVDAELRARRAGVRHPGAVPTLPTASPTRPPAAAPPEGARWTVHTADNTTVLPGEPVRSEGEPEIGDAAVDEAAVGITASLDLFRDVYDRESFDAKGSRTRLTVHYGLRYANAFWDGTQLVFGDGDGEIFGRFTAALDVLGHEFTHGVTEYAAGLVYQGQSGALNESVSDVFAACAQQRVLGQDAAEADWLIGAGIFLPGVRARGLRDMAEPGTAYDDPRLGQDPQPAHLDDYVETTDDNGGVHINSGIPNRAFVLAARAIGGSAAEGAGRIWYAALTSGDVRPDTDFAGFAAATVAASGEHAGLVRDAWAEVGLAVTGGAVGSDAWSPDPTPADPGGVVRVTRSGGFAGRTVEGTVDPASFDPPGPEVADLVQRVDLTGVRAGGASHPDGFVYSFHLPDGRDVTLPESELTGDLADLARLVLERGGSSGPML